MAPKKNQRGFIGDDLKECVAQPNNRKAAGADEIVNELQKYGREGVITVMDMKYS